MSNDKVKPCVLRFGDEWHGIEDVTGKRNRPVIVTRPDGEGEWHAGGPAEGRGRRFEEERGGDPGWDQGE